MYQVLTDMTGIDSVRKHYWSQEGYVWDEFSDVKLEGVRQVGKRRHPIKGSCESRFLWWKRGEGAEVE